MQQQLAQGATRLTPQQMKALQARQKLLQAATQGTRLTPELVKQQQQQLRRLASPGLAVSTGQVSAVTTPATVTVQKAVSIPAPIITSVGQATQLPQTARLVLHFDSFQTIIDNNSI